jgi:hypothetical protein
MRNLVLMAWIGVAAAQDLVTNFPANRATPLTPVDTVAARPALRATAPGAEEDGGFLYSLYVMNGNDGVRRYSTTLLLMNVSAEPVRVRVEFLDRAGKPLRLPFADDRGLFRDYYSAALGEIPAGGVAGPTLMYRSEPVRAGWARIWTDRPEALRLVNWLNSMEGTQGEMLHTSSAVSLETPHHLMVETDVASEQTMVTLANTGVDPAKVAIEVRSTEGRPLCATSVTLAPGQQLYRTNRELIGCARPVGENYVLTLVAEGSEVVMQAHYEYTRFVWAPAFLTAAEAEEEQ